MQRRLKAINGLISDLGNIEYEDLETRRLRSPASLEKGIEEAPVSERTATSLPVGFGRPAERPPEYRRNVDDVAEQDYSGSPNRERFDTPEPARDVPPGMRPVERNNEQGSGRFPTTTMSQGRGKTDVPPVTEAHETQRGKMPVVTQEPEPVIKRARRKSMLKL